jgi:tetratricopeptide (TPR) repeat protein
MDSIRVVQWREYYNAGVSQIGDVEDAMETMRIATDSAELAYYRTTLEAMKDSCQDNMALALAIDNSDPKPYVGLASIHEKMENYKEAIAYYEKALPLAENRTDLLVEVAYDYVRDGDYCGAYPWFQEWVDSMTIREEVMSDPSNREAVISTIHNLASCYNNCKVYDSAYLAFHRIIDFEPTDYRALQGAARYQQHLGREASDSAQLYRETDTVQSAAWGDTRDQHFDSAVVYLQNAFEANQDDADLAAEYGLMLAIRQRFEEAQVPFARACELDPTSHDNWTSLGDCRVSLQDWAGAAEAYEHVVELQPDNKTVWEQLELLYSQGHKNPERLAEVREKLKSL